MADRYLFSVVIPTFNRARYLPEALDSVFAQGVGDVQVIVVDDGSTDGTRSVVANYGRGVVYLYQRRAGAAAARNRGIALAAGTYVSFLDSDDVWLPGKMALELSLFEALPEAEAVISDARFWELDEIFVASRFEDRGLFLAPGQPTLFPPGDPRLPWLSGSLFATCCLTLRRSALAKLGPAPFDTAFARIEDWEARDPHVPVVHRRLLSAHPGAGPAVRGRHPAGRPAARRAADAGAGAGGAQGA